jgi:hypothetical protein
MERVLLILERVPLVAGTQRDHWETLYFMYCATGGALRNRAESRNARNMIFNDILKQELTRANKKGAIK